MKHKGRVLLSRLVILAILSPIFAQGDAVLDWNDLALDCVRSDNTAPTISTRNLSILNTAMYDALNSITRTHQPCLFELTAPTNCSAEAAVVAAGYEVITSLYPSYIPWANDLYDNFLSTQPPNEALTNGLNLGLRIALLTLNSRSDDGANTDLPYIPSDLPGQWQRTPPFYRPPLTPQWGELVPFCLPDIEPFIPPSPPPLDSAEYAIAFNEVKNVGGATSTNRTPEQSQIAVFWSDFSYTAMPPGHWHEIAAAIALSCKNSLEQNARLFALLSLAQADAAIVCWATKYRYNSWRPITAIQRADEDGNPGTQKDASWSHYLAAPPFPSYMSGHSTFSKASAQVLTRFYGTDAISFSATSDSLPGVVRTFTSLSGCADEIGMSRVYGGIHFQFDNEAGKRCGQLIGDYISKNFLLVNAELPKVQIEGFSNAVPLLRIHGRIGENCILERSSNLVDWQPIATNSPVQGGTVVCDTSSTSATSRFYMVTEAKP
jgi:hypothetical protein